MMRRNSWRHGMDIDNTVVKLRLAEKEIAKLKRENKKLCRALKNEGIEPDIEVLNKKQGDLLTGKELEFAAKNKLKVRYICKMYDANDRYKNCNIICVMKECSNNTDEHYYYIGDSDICLEDYGDKDEVFADFEEGTFEVRKVKGVQYQ
jgi:hypothetical protein